MAGVSRGFIFTSFKIKPRETPAITVLRSIRISRVDEGEGSWQS